MPTQLVKQVDILTGGASAVYGSDAVAGVANFILETDFEGVQIGGQLAASYASNDHSRSKAILRAGNQPVPGSNTDGEETLFFAKVGVNLDEGRGNATLFFSYDERESILQADRDFSACALRIPGRTALVVSAASAPQTIACLAVQEGLGFKKRMGI